LQAYDQALKLDPQLADAAANQKLIKDAMKKQQPPPKQQGSNSQAGDGKQDKSGKQQDKPGKQQDSKAGKQGKTSQSDKQQQEAKAAEQQAAKKKSEQQQAADKQEEQAQGAEKKSDPQDAKASAASDDKPQTDKQRADQQWLERIPDDPGGLLRRKFKYQYSQRQRRQTSDKLW